MIGDPGEPKAGRGDAGKVMGEHRTARGRAGGMQGR